MGQMRFLIPQGVELPPGAAEVAYLAGMDGIPWHSNIAHTESDLTVSRQVNESGNLYIPWNVAGHGQVIVSTASLMEREEAYHLPVELARGTINRVRNYTAEWQLAGMNLSEKVLASTKEATRGFVRAANTQSSDPVGSAVVAQQVVTTGLDVIRMMSAELTAHILKLRHEQEPRLMSLLAANVGTLPLDDATGKYVQAGFNSAMVPIVWRDVQPHSGEDFRWDELDRQIEWCRAAGLRICAGPLLQLGKSNVPDWMYIWEDDFENVKSHLKRFVTAVAGRYKDKVHLWISAAGMNLEGALTLSEEERMNLTIRAISSLREVDKRTPMIVSFDRPWGEYLAHEDLDLTPLHFADDLVRGNFGVAGLGLEINLGYWPQGTPYRDALDIGRLADRWHLLGLPLVVFLTVPSAQTEDPLARRAKSSIPMPNGAAMTLDAQRDLGAHLASLLLAKPAVHGLVWNQISDAEPHDFAHGGLFDEQRQPKPILNALTEIRREHLK